jgi:hypothetical protein
MSMMRGLRVVGVDAFHALERARLVKDRVEVTDQQNLLRRTRMRRDEVTGTLPGRAVNPFGLESPVRTSSAGR